jgi:glutamate synthase domain-containing protein 3
VPKQADVYWNARGGSHTDGGAFVFSIVPENGKKRLEVTNKFGSPVEVKLKYDRSQDLRMATALDRTSSTSAIVADGSGELAFSKFRTALPTMGAEQAMAMFATAVQRGSKGGSDLDETVRFLTLVIDRKYDPGTLRRSRLTEKALEALNAIFRAQPRIGSEKDASLVDRENMGRIEAPTSQTAKLLIDCRGFPMEGEEGPSFAVRRAFEKGWRHAILFDAHGQRFFGCGLGQASHGMLIEAYGTPGDYLASGLAGASVIVHGNAQDQLCQIMASGRLVVHGDVGQTFMYGAKGGEAFIKGNAAGRPLINAVGKPRVVINGTCLDYLAESFMAGDPLNGGGFVILNGMGFTLNGQPIELPTPYPGGNLFSLASGGAIYVRDPKGKVTADQLNGGRFGKMTEADWNLILPYLKENEALFEIPIEGFLLTVDGERRSPSEVYRKIEAVPLKSMSKAEQELEDFGD